MEPKVIAIAHLARFCFYLGPLRIAQGLPAQSVQHTFIWLRGRGMSHPPMLKLARTLRQNGLIRFVEHFAELFPNSHLKDLVVDDVGPDRQIRVNGRTVTNFGSDSFLGLDQDPRVQEAVIRGTHRWGTHNGASRAFASVSANIEAEDKIASWLG